MTIYLGADHAGFKLKGRVKEWLASSLKFKENEIMDFGALAYDEKDDYPDFVRPVAQAVANDPEQSRGIIIGGSGQGEAMCANRVAGVRAAVYYGAGGSSDGQKIGVNIGSSDELNIIKLSRQHNDANVLSLGARFLTDEEALKAVQLFLETSFSGDERHIRRLAKF